MKELRTSRDRRREMLWEAFDVVALISLIAIALHLAGY